MTGNQRGKENQPAVRVEEECLLREAAAGDYQALEEIMLRYKGLVRYKARSMFMAGADVEDIIQEGMIGLFQAVRTYQVRKKVPFPAYASRCIGSRMIDAVRKASRRKHQPLNESISLQAFQQDEDDMILLNVLADDSRVNPEHALLEREGMRDLGEFVRNELSELERDVLLQYIETASYRETAAKLSCSVKTVDNALGRARSKFKKYRDGNAEDVKAHG